jgi:hypothetical protein
MSIVEVVRVQSGCQLQWERAVMRRRSEVEAPSFDASEGYVSVKQFSERLISFLFIDTANRKTVFERWRSFEGSLIVTTSVSHSHRLRSRLFGALSPPSPYRASEARNLHVKLYSLSSNLMN